jgi:hypothetical protein
MSGPRLPRAFFGEVDPVRLEKCGTAKNRAVSTQVETAVANVSELQVRVGDPQGHVSEK